LNTARNDGLAGGSRFEINCYSIKIIKTKSQMQLIVSLQYLLLFFSITSIFFPLYLKYFRWRDHQRTYKKKLISPIPYFASLNGKNRLIFLQISKSQAILITTGDAPLIRMGNNTIYYCEKVKNLGRIMNQHLSWEDHVARTCSSVFVTRLWPNCTFYSNSDTVQVGGLFNCSTVPVLWWYFAKPSLPLMRVQDIFMVYHGSNTYQNTRTESLVCP
jgi:hypothetical protein